MHGVRAAGSGFGATNILLQNQCVLDQSDRLEIAADPVALADVLNALDPAHPVRVPCLVVLPITGPVGRCLPSSPLPGLGRPLD